MKTTSETGPESLITEQDWVAPLVRRLVRDEASAEDVLQSTWLRALRHPPRAEKGSRSWGSWFARVARNLASREGELAGARRERELRAARGERLPSTHEIAEREELRARIVAHVLALPEPYRGTLVLRFYEGLEPRAIARAQGVNGSTVRNRIARGLGLLRERMEREQGKEWVSSCLAVLPLGSAKLLVAHAGWTGWIAKGGIVANKLQVATAAAVAVTAGAVWFAWPSSGGSDALVQKRGSEVALSKDAAGLALPHGGAGQDAALETADAGAGAREAAQQRTPADAAEVAGTAAGVRVFGHVRDMRGEPINNSGGTFSFQMAEGAMVSGDVPVINFVSTNNEPQQVQGLNLTFQVETAVNVLQPPLDKQEELAVKFDSEDALRADKIETQQALDKELLGKVVNRIQMIGSTRIVFADSEGCQFTANTNTDSSYSVEGLHPGKWHTIATHDNKLCRRQDFEIEKDQHQFQLDLVLDDELSVRVKMRTPDGRELNEAIAADPELSYRVALSPVALRPGSAARFLPQGKNQNFGCGRYEDRNDLEEKRRAEIGDASGVLTIGEAPPIDVGLAMCGQLIARRPLSAGQDEVEFVVSLEDLRRCFATVVVHVVDSKTHAPIVGAQVSIEGVQTLVQEQINDAVTGEDQAAEDARREQDKRDGAGDPKTDAQGVARIPWVLAGKHNVFAQAHGYSAFNSRVEIEAGGTCELKPVELTGHARISGRIVDAQGRPVKTSFEFVPLDRFEETHETLSGIRWSTNEQGAFEVPDQRRERYLVRGAEGDGVLAPFVVDATQGDVGDLELHQQVPSSAQIVFTREPKEGAELRVTTAAGLPVVEQDLSGFAPAPVTLAPGSYMAEVREGARKAGSVRFVVGKDAVRIVLPLD